MAFTKNTSEHKMRINLSPRAEEVVQNDRSIYEVERGTFINKVFEIYKDTARASIALRMRDKKEGLDYLLSDAKLDGDSKQVVIDKLLKAEEKELTEHKKDLLAESGVKGFHPIRINNANVEYLENICLEDEYYGECHAAQYIRAVLEEYCQMPFVQREKIYHHDVYEAIQRAIDNKETFVLYPVIDGKPVAKVVYPYKIMQDTLRSQSYLACYTRDEDGSFADKRTAAFAMAKLNDVPKSRKNQKGKLGKEDISHLFTKINTVGISYLLNDVEEIKVRLTDEGKRIFLKQKLAGRPANFKVDGKDKNLFIFQCTRYQIRHYFMDLGKNAEIISPASLREEFKKDLQAALKLYT